MTTTYEKLSSNKVKLNFTVEPEKFEEGIKKAYQKVVKKINIPGFRRGKAPMKVIEAHYGESVFYEDAFDAIFPEIYQAAPSTMWTSWTVPSWMSSRSAAARSSSSPSRCSCVPT